MSLTDAKRSAYAAALGLTDAQLSTMSLQDLEFLYFSTGGGGAKKDAVSEASSAVKSYLNRKRSATLQVIGDSTGDAKTEWFGILGNLLSAANPNYTLAWRQWNGTSIQPPEILSQGAAGERYVELTDGRLFFTNDLVGAVNPSLDVDVRLKVAPTNWKPGGAAAVRTLAARWWASGNYAFTFYLDQDGYLCWAWSTNGTSVFATNKSTAAVPFTGSTPGWVRVQFDTVNPTATGSTTTFFTSTNGTNWTQLGTEVTVAGINNIYSTTIANYSVGGRGSSAADFLSGKFYAVEIYSDIMPSRTLTTPYLPEDWDFDTSGSTTVAIGGAPVLMMICTGQSGAASTYFNGLKNIVGAPLSQDLLFINLGHNEGNPTSKAWQALLASFHTWIRNRFPNIPIVYVGQNPVRIGTYVTTQMSADIRHMRQAATASWAPTIPGAYFWDSFPYFTDLDMQLSTDNLHPSDEGHRVWGSALFNALF